MKNLSMLTKSMLVALTVTGIGATAIAAPVANTKAVPSSNEALSAMQSKISLTQAINIAKQNAKGDLVSAEFELEKGQSVYDIEVVKGNQIYDVSIDANTGKVLSSQVDVEDDD